MFKLPPLPYAETALEPSISAATLAVHYGKHHASYISKANAALKERPNAPASLEEVVRLAARENDTALFNNAAQAWNHAFFWECMTPDFTAPSGAIAKAIDTAFGSLQGFKDEFLARGTGHFASGWAWLVADKSGALELRDLHDANTPITNAALTPIIVCDVWEHAYYLDYKNERGKFLQTFVDRLINWRFAAAQYEAARAGERGWLFPA
ncbi:MAG: superoxide dismutase [Hyphomonadaceae bacterium]|nr:superoxide dismutase [Hyphomonadaceae bacterium]